MNKANGLVSKDTHYEAFREENLDGRRRQRKKWEVNEAEDFGSLIKPNAPFLKANEEGKSTYQSPTAAHVNRVVENEKAKKPLHTPSPVKPTFPERPIFSDPARLPPSNSYTSNSPATAPARTIGIKPKSKPPPTVPKPYETPQEIQMNNSSEVCIAKISLRIQDCSDCSSEGYKTSTRKACSTNSHREPT